MQRLKSLVAFLEKRQSLCIHQNVSQFYYMQRLEELSTLFDQFEETQRKMEGIVERLNGKYIQTFEQWRTDVLWIHRCQGCRVKRN